MSASTSRATNKKRTTSSAGYKFPGVPVSEKERTKLVQGELQQQLRRPKWVAEVVKVQQCTSTEYNGGDGYKTIFEYSAAEPAKTALLVAEGGVSKLTLRVQINAVRLDPSPTILKTFEITEDDNLYTIRLFDHKWSMDIHVDPRKSGRGRAKPVGDYWAIHLRLHHEAAIKAAKTMLRRVENAALEMPDKWFKYRNFFTKPSQAASAPETSDTPHSSQGSATQGAYEEEMAGGYRVRWTGALATPMFLRAMGYENIRPPRQPSPEMDDGGEPAPARRVTRSEAEELRKKGAFRHSTLPLRTKVVAEPKNRKEVAAAKKARKENSRRNRRAAMLDPETVSEDEDDEGQSPSGSPAEGKAKGTEAVQPSDSLDDPNKSWPIKGILNDQVIRGVKHWLVDWEGDYQPSWEPREHLEPESIETYERSKATRSRGGRRGRSNRRGRGGRRG